MCSPATVGLFLHFQSNNKFKTDENTIISTTLLTILNFAIAFGAYSYANDPDFSKNSYTKGSVSKKPVFEIFTSSTCILCVAFVPGIDEVLNNNPGQYSVIKYQMDWPDSGDPYFTEQAGVRGDYYGIMSISELLANGSVKSASGFDQKDFDEYTMDSTDLDIGSPIR